ncbi:arginase family protein [Kitasatospora sp. GAS204B]|uniref:arginase family protein n=1 Tax=unclassified Kitasatospora TaxID=2633591 RepID=UPI0032AFC9AA
MTTEPRTRASEDRSLTEPDAFRHADAVIPGVDVVGAGMAPGTGSPGPGGDLSTRQLLNAIRRSTMELPLAGVDVIEAWPRSDHAGITAICGNRVSPARSRPQPRKTTSGPQLCG